MVEPPAKSREEIRSGLIEEISGRYSISEEDTELLRVEPEKVLPKLMGEAFVDIYEAVYYGIMSQMPDLVSNLSTRNTVATGHQDTVYKEFPELNDPKYAEQLEIVGPAYRKAYPNATAEQAIEGIGKTAMAMLGLTKAVPEPDKPAPAAKPKMPSVPAAAAVGSGELKPEIPDDPLKILETIDFDYPDS